MALCLATLPISFAPWPHRHKEAAFLYLALFCSKNFYYKCKTHVTPSFLNLETDSFKVTLWILFIHIPWFYHNLFWQASRWRLVPHNHNPEGKKLGLLIQSQKYFIFQLVQKHQLYFPSTFFTLYLGFNSGGIYIVFSWWFVKNAVWKCFQIPNKS